MMFIITELTNTEMLSVLGGFNGDEFFTGGAVIAIACAPVKAPIAAMAGGAASGWFCGDGLDN
jgi:hypothetical protein